MAFELKHFTPEQLDKLAALNPNLTRDLGLEPSIDELKAELIEIQDRNAQTWVLMTLAYQAKEEALREFEKNRRGKPLATPIQLLGALLFFFLLLKLI